MKRITLDFAERASWQEPSTRTFKVDYEGEDFIIVSGAHLLNQMTLNKLPDGTFVNEHHVPYVQVKPDRRPKPYSVVGHEEGRGPAFTKKFATIEEVREYVRGQWQGWDYWDGGNSFHSDYCTFEVRGIELRELVPQREEPWKSYGS